MKIQWFAPVSPFNRSAIPASRCVRLRRFAAALLALALLVPLCRCSSDDSGDPTLYDYIAMPFTAGPVYRYDSMEGPQRGRLLTSQQKWDLSQSTFNTLVSLFMTYFGTSLTTYPLFAPDNGARFHYITYETLNTDGSLVTVSGALWVPTDATPTRLLAYGHGTMINSDITSSRIEPGLFAGKGYMAVSSDYLGYGASEALGHPYCHARTMAISTIDAIRAARKFAKYNGIALANSDIIIVGYSEGGMTAMATTKAIAEDSSLTAEFTIYRSAPMSGPYDIRGTADALIQYNTKVVPHYLCFIIPAYDRAYGLNRPLDHYLREPYATWFTEDPIPRPDAEAIAELLPTNSSDLLQDAFIYDYTHYGEVQIKAALDDNNTYKFKPLIPIKLYAGNGDTHVPVANTNTALAYFASVSAPSVTSDIKSAGAGDHGALVLPCFYDAITTYFP
ncbi:MAG: hypothetical protein JXA20_01320 [Spirochaetes bacterium]|nr:hypothetical protein [Spirochaetota bacterium]